MSSHAAVLDSPVILLGATGQVGRFALPRLLATGHRVIATLRGTRPLGLPAGERMSWVRPDDLEVLVSGFDRPAAVLSCGPVAVAARLCEGLERFERIVALSTSSVLSKADSASEVERAGIRAIRKAESDLRRRCERSNTPLAILRPTLIYGCGLDDNVSRIHRWIRRFGFFPVAGDAQGLRQPLHADDLAEVSVALLATDFGRYFESPVCGASTLSFDEMVARVGAAAGSDHRGLRVPMALLSGTAWLADVILRGPHSRREMVRRQARDLVFDDSRLRTMTGVAAREFAPVARDFTLPVA